jgi:hypothetical protein
VNLSSPGTSLKKPLEPYLTPFQVKVLNLLQKLGKENIPVHPLAIQEKSTCGNWYTPLALHVKLQNNLLPVGVVERALKVLVKNNLVESRQNGFFSSSAARPRLEYRIIA